MERKKPTDVCVFHLVWAPYGLGTFEEFVASYRANPAELPHRLRIIFNGFAPGFDYTPYRTMLDGLEYDSLTTVQAVQDLAAYFTAVESVDTPFVCFLNSYCQIQEPGWLAKLYRHAQRERVGVVGATGSYWSAWNTPNFYEGLPKNRYLRAVHLRLERWLPGWFPAGSESDLMWRPHLLDFPGFPNYHIRTNGFLLRRALMIRLKRPRFRNKMECYKFEHGRQSMTQQLLKKGLEPLVVGRDGRAYGKEEWYESRTLHSGDQSNLLISDNMTRLYAGLDREMRWRYAVAIWGEKAETEEKQEKAASAEALAGRPMGWPAGTLDA
jgi:hypothetical protein